MTVAQQLCNRLRVISRSGALGLVALSLGSVAALLTLLLQLPGSGRLARLLGGDLLTLALVGVVACVLALTAAWFAVTRRDRVQAGVAMGLGLVPVALVAVYLTTGEG